MPQDRAWFDEISSLLEAKPRPADFPPTMVTMPELRQTLDDALEESRKTSDPFSVLLFSVRDPRGEVDPEVLKEWLRPIGFHILDNLRTTFNPHFPPRKLDVVSWWDYDFVAVCFNADREMALIPANRVIAKVERAVPDSDGLTLRVVAWGWSWRSGGVSEVSILRQLRDELKSESDQRITAVPESMLPLERRVMEILERLQRPR